MFALYNLYRLSLEVNVILSVVFYLRNFMNLEFQLEKLLDRSEKLIEDGALEDEIHRQKFNHVPHPIQKYVVSQNDERNAGKYRSPANGQQRVTSINQKLGRPLSLASIPSGSMSGLTRQASIQLMVKNKTGKSTLSELMGVSESGTRNRNIVSDVPSDQLVREENLHEDMTGEMLKMVEILKSNAKAVEKILETDERVMNEGQHLLGDNLNRLVGESKRLKLFSSQSGRTTLAIWILLFFVCMLFVLAFMMIRVFPKQ
ncbi:hypothetical protein ROZALSC1DRAFT_27275 [Rozella allomycis CSF55]|uniref:Vesicle transport protein USE1 n=1 Tax=Rozella allomycis (strain CSF55) TaxID=988480 RepID=A0A075B5D0_ROZAC|nr:hypothetical protein O9G_004332 [Rozella allomycis CSF55]RKP21308.1 hypothetical protein ROZALSC1DRAFT_27275 [Rozella allomycis CSF55]|eukprot:EPZ37084.1 hypothetical protein O9G_004332 [Rozella allomycis CSF55]